MAKVLACNSRGREFNSQPFRCQGKLFTHVLCHQAVYFGTSHGQQCPATGKVTVGLASHWPCITDISGLATYRLKA